MRSDETLSGCKFGSLARLRSCNLGLMRRKFYLKESHRRFRDGNSNPYSASTMSADMNQSKNSSSFAQCRPCLHSAVLSIPLKFLQMGP